jgi:hypothetical protein
MRTGTLSRTAVAFTLGALAACHGSSTSSTDAATPSAAAKQTVAESTSGIVTARNACDLLTRSDAEMAIGQPLPQNTANVTLGMCDYNAADFSAGASLTVGSWESIRNAATGGAHQPQPISGIGDGALYFAGKETGSGPIYVRRGNEGFLLSLNGPRIDHMIGADAVAVQTDLALKILKRF